jgi:hypothetical protein
VIKKSEEIISELGATKTGPIYDKLLQMGVDHENYQIQAPSLEESRLIGSGAQNKVNVIAKCRMAKCDRETLEKAILGYIFSSSGS